MSVFQILALCMQEFCAPAPVLHYVSLTNVPVSQTLIVRFVMIEIFDLTNKKRHNSEVNNNCRRTNSKDGYCLSGKGDCATSAQ